jgi:hypothetical protein
LTTFAGRCQCGAIGFDLETSRSPAQWAIRACQCRFCRSHGARTTSDPEGSVRFVIVNASKLNRYRFASRSADFFLCRDCGAYIAAVVDTPSGSFATLNVNVLLPAIDLSPATPVSYDAEDPAQKLARREHNWTPVTDLA